MPENIDVNILGTNQKLAAGNDFSNNLPTTDIGISDPMKQFDYPEDSQAGRIDLPDRAHPIAIRQIALKLGGNQTWWKIWWFDGDTHHLQSEGTTESYFIWSGERLCLPGQYMWVETAGASADPKKLNAIWSDIDLV